MGRALALVLGALCACLGAACAAEQAALPPQTTDRDATVDATLAPPAQPVPPPETHTTTATATEPGPAPAPGPGERGVVRRVSDGDTLELRDGRNVRLVQIDAPEQFPPEAEECYGDEARRELRSLVPPGTEVVLERDPRLDDRDRFDRLLRYVVVADTIVNLVLVERGAAAPYFFAGERGQYADRLLAAAEGARDLGTGLWGACPKAELNPRRNLATGPPP